MIDHGRWIGTLPLIKNKDSDHNTFCTNPNKWTDTLPKQKTKNAIRQKPPAGCTNKKQICTTIYCMAFLFVFLSLN